MATSSTISSNSIKFGDEFEIDAGAYELRKAGQPVKLGRIPMDMLLLLVEQRGQLVTRDKIVEKIWGKDVFLDTDNSINAAIRKIRQTLQDDPEQPRFVQTVVGRGYRFIAPVEETETPQSVAPEPIPEFRIRKKFLQYRATKVALAIATASVVVAGFASLNIAGVRAWPFNRESSSLSANSFRARPSMAVLGFKNLSGNEDKAWISTALSELLSSDLAAGQQLRIIPGEDVARMKVDLSLPAADTYSRDTLGKVRIHLGSDMVVLGSYLAVGADTGDKIRINLQVQDATSGETVAAVSKDGTEADLSELVSQSGDTLRRILRVSGVAADAAANVRAALPANSKAARLYAEALGKLRSFDTLGARDLLLQAASADPNHALSHAALSECWSDLGYDIKAQEEAKKAFDLSSKLSREEQLSIEGRYRVTTREWPRAVEIYRMLWEFFPDNPDYGLKLASLQVSARLGKDAMATVERLSKLSLPGGGDPRVDLVAATAAENVGDFKRMQQLAAIAAEKGRGRSSGLLVAQAKLLEGASFGRLSDTVQAAASLKEAEIAFAKAGDLNGAATSILETGIAYYYQGDFNAAFAKFEESLSIFRRLGTKRNMARALKDMGNVLYDQGKLNEAQERYQQALALNRETGYKSAVAGDLGNIANVLDSAGRLAEARDMQEQSLAAYSDAGDKSGAAITLNNLGNLLDELGALSDAIQHFERAEKLNREVGGKRGIGFTLAGWGLVLLEQDRLTEAHSKLEEALALRKQTGDQLTVAESQLYLAQLLLEEDRTAEAENVAREAAAQFARSKSAENETIAYATLARALLAQNKVQEARAAADHAVAISRNTNYLSPHFEASMASALVDSFAGNQAEARRKLDQVIEQTGKLGFVGYELRARRDRGLSELRSGNTAAARAYLATVRKDAAAKGYRLIARKAAS